MEISLKQKQALEKRRIDPSKHEKRIIQKQKNLYISEYFKKSDLHDDKFYIITDDYGDYYLIEAENVSETDSEFASRLIKEYDQKIREKERKKSQDARDLKLYQKLKKKFEEK